VKYDGKMQAKINAQSNKLSQSISLAYHIVTVSVKMTIQNTKHV